MTPARNLLALQPIRDRSIQLSGARGVVAREGPALDAPAGHPDAADVPLAFALLLAAVSVDWRGRSSQSP